MQRIQACKQSKHSERSLIAVFWRTLDISCYLYILSCMVFYCIHSGIRLMKSFCFSCNTLLTVIPTLLLFSWALGAKLLQEYSLNQPCSVKYSAHSEDWIWNLGLCDSHEALQSTLTHECIQIQYLNRVTSVRKSVRPLTERIKKCHVGYKSNYNNNNKLLWNKSESTG